MDNLNIKVDDCPICKEAIYKKELFVTDCNHKFHKKCFCEWIKNNGTCPLCRSPLTTLDLEVINTDYKFKLKKLNKKNNFKDVYINQNIFNNILHLKPHAWINIFIDFKETTNLAPLYKIESLNGKSYIIDFFLRQALLFFEFDEIKVLKISNKKQTFYTISESYSLVNRKTYTTMVDWFYEVMILLKNKYSFVYLVSMNTLFLDLFTITLLSNSKFNETSLYQTIILSTIYNIIKIYIDIEIDKKFLIYLSDNSSKEDMLDELITYQYENIINQKLIKV